jgi:ABC-2 type transport system permease protein
MSAQSPESVERARALAAEPMRPAGPAKGLHLGTVQTVRDVWGRRQLLDLLIRRELKARYKDSTLGFLWSLLRPLTLLLIYYVAIGKFMNAEQSPRNTGGIPDFAIYIFTGLTAWSLVNEIIITGTGSILANAGLVKKVYLPREIFPLASIGSALFNFGVQLVVLVAATVVAGDLPVFDQLGYALLGFALILVLGTALALLLAAANVYLRDVQYLVEIALMVLFWASPVVYSWKLVADALSPALEQVYLANPITLAVLGFQRAFWTAGANQPTPDNLAPRMWIALGVSVVLLWVSQRVFTRLQGNFAQEL